MSQIQPGMSEVPYVAPCAASKFKGEPMLSHETTRTQSLLDNDVTSMKGPLLGIVKPSWTSCGK